MSVKLFFHAYSGAAVISSIPLRAVPALPASCLNRNAVGTMGHLIDFFTLQQQKKKLNPHNVFPSHPRDYFLPLDTRDVPYQPSSHPQFIFSCLVVTELSDRLLVLW